MPEPETFIGRIVFKAFVDCLMRSLKLREADERGTPGTRAAQRRARAIAAIKTEGEELEECLRELEPGAHAALAAIVLAGRAH